MDGSNSGLSLVPNSNQSYISNEIQWFVVSKRDGKSKLLPRGMIFVGREECDIILSSTTVDKRHAVIFFNTTNEQFHVKDLNSKYGTYVNEKRIPDQCYLKLEHLDRLRFGFGPDVFVIQRISCLSLTSNKSYISPQMTNSANSITTSNLNDSEDSFEKEENLLMKSVNYQNNKNYNNNEKSESIVSQIEAQTHCSEEQTSTPLSTTPINENINTSPDAHLNNNTHTVLPPTQLISSLNENYENNSSSSLSTVDSLDEIKPSKRVVNNKVLSPVRESNEITNNFRDLCLSESINKSKEDNCLKNKKNWQIVSNENCSATTDSTTPASTSNTPISGSAMAFIIPFDSDDKSFKKKLNIKDSLRQFAPPKPDSIEKPRPQKTANSDLNKTFNLFGNQKSPTMQSKQKKNTRSTPLTKRNSFNALNETNGHLSDSATYLIHRMLCSQNSETQNTIPVKDLIESSNMRRNSNELSSKSSQTIEKCSPTNSGEKDSGVSDDNKSETGTYTVELDPNDNDLENARKKIDEIFGVFDDRNSFSLHSSPEVLSPESPVNSVQNLMLSHEKFVPNNKLNNQSILSPKFSRKFITGEEISGLPQDSKSMANTSTFTRSKRKPPTPPNHLVRNELKSDNEIRNKSNVLKDFPALYSNELSNKIKNISEMVSSHNGKAFSNGYNSSQNHDIISLNSNNNNNNNNNKPKSVTNSHSAPATPRSPLMARKILQLKESSKVFNNRRKNSWNNSNSDLDHYESYNSDESTDQSQRSSNSALSKEGGNNSCASVPSKMRFNSAFALRRARLGIETPGIPVDMNKNKNKINSNIKQDKQKSGFSRNDGGRFSLRLSKSDANDNSRKVLNQNNSINRIGSQEKVNKTSLQRKVSDPLNGKTLSGNRTALKLTQSDTDRSVNNRANSPWIHSLRQNINNSKNINNNNNNNNNNGLQKSASFADSKVLDCNRNSDNNSSVRSIPTFQMGKRFFSTKPHQMAQIENSIRAKNATQKVDIMSLSMTEGSHKSPESPTSSAGKSSPQHQNKSKRELSALDGLVVSAVNQLSLKLRTNMRSLLERERVKHQTGSETRILIDEILPQVSSPDRRLNDNNDSNISRDLSNILKNLKKVEQSFDVVSMLLNPNAITSLSSRRTSNGFFVDV